MESNEHNNWVINALVTACAALAAAVGFLTKKKKPKPEPVMIPIHSTEHFDRLVKIADSFQGLANQFKTEIDNALKNERIRVDKYHERLGRLEDEVNVLKTQMEGMVDVEKPSLWENIDKIKEKAGRDAERISKIEGALGISK